MIIGGSGYSNSPVYISHNHGESFIPLHEGLPNTLVFKLAGTPNDEYFFAATEVGPYVYITEEDMWSDLSGISAPDQTYWSVEYIPDLNTARFGTYGRGIWDFIIDDTPNLEGDINFDDSVNIQDIILTINLVLNNEYNNSADLNLDSTIDILDIVQLVNVILN